MPPSPKLRAAAARRRGTKSQGGDLFVWTIIILLLIGLALASWIGSISIFGHPERGLNYTILSKLKKIAPPRRFELTAAPRGEFLNPEKLIERFGGMTPREMQRTSAEFLRAYLRNYHLSPGLVPYVVGDFTILDSFELTPANFFPSGVGVLAQAREHPELVLEHIFPAEPRVVPVLQRMLLTGLDLKLSRGLDLSAVLNVRRLPDGRLQVTAVPLLYGSYASTDSDGTFSLTPPSSLNVAAGLPVYGGAAVVAATEKFNEHRRRAGLPALPGMPPPAQPRQLVRVERPEPVNPPPAPTATPGPQLPPAVPTPSRPVLAEAVLPTPTPNFTPPPSTPPPPLATPTPTPGAVVAASGGTWPVYEPGRMPRGRLLNLRDIPDLASRGVAGERIYLQGSFVVTASGNNRAVLRNQGAITEALGIRGRSSNIRVIVEFPQGGTPPSEGSTVQRDSMRPFQIIEVRTGSDGQINVFAREVTR